MGQISMQIPALRGLVLGANQHQDGPMSGFISLIASSPLSPLASPGLSGHSWRLFLRHPLWNRHHGSRGEDAVAGIELHGHSGEHPLPGRCRTAHRPHEVRCIGTGKHLLDELGFLPVAAREISISSSTTPAFINRQRTPIASSPGLVDRRRSAESALAAGRKEGVPYGWAGSHPGHSDAGEIKAQDPTDGTFGKPPSPIRSPPLPGHGWKS